MGYYIQVEKSFQKANQLIGNYKAQLLISRPKWSDIPEGKALIVVVHNPIFEAAAFAFDENEYNTFHGSSDLRAKQYLLMDRKQVETLTGFNEKG